MSIPKLPPYKQQLLDHLADCGWELAAIDQPDWDDALADPFIAEQWTIRSVRELRGCELVLTFVEPESFGYFLVATTHRPINHLQCEDRVAILEFNTGLYNETMMAFVREINDHRDGLRSQDNL